MEACLSNLFEDVRHERSIMLILSLTDSDILKQSKFTDDEIKIIKYIAFEKLHRQRILKQCIAMDLLEDKQTILYNHFISNIEYFYTCMNELS